MSDQKSDNDKNEEIDATTYLEKRKRAMVKHLVDIIDFIEDKKGENNAPPCGFLHITFFENGDNNTLIAGEYNPMLLYGTFFDTILKMRDNSRDAEVKKLVEEGIAIVEKTMHEGSVNN